VDFAEYVRQLADDLYLTYKVSNDEIVLDVEIDVPQMSIDIAIPCGLLINELMSNAFKHAFADAVEGRLRVALRRSGDNTNVLIVADTGAGFPGGLDFRNTASFGLQLVNTLVEQLHGEIELKTDRGTEFTVTFPEMR
jgi:two-component sensor histidine kinase